MSPAMPPVGVAARPSQALRQRRESQRPTLARSSTKSTANAVNQENMDSGAAQDNKRPHVITQKYILSKYNHCAPSLRVYLYTTHFRINDSQESLAYSSPMKELIVHLRERTVPHNMLDEFYRIGVQFYDNCLIVEVHDFKTGGVSPKDNTANVSNTKGADPFSIHNHNDYITPSPYMPFPQKSPAKGNQVNGQAKGIEAKDEKDVDKENMPAPGQPASSQKQPAKARIYTVVLFPTPQSELIDIQLMSMTPYSDTQTYRRSQQTGRSQENPPTPLTAVPPTPTLPSGRSPKRRKMIVDETNKYEIEAELLLATSPSLYLEPTKSLQESVALIDALTHPNNKHPAPERQSRKRTTAELAADEADEADRQRFMLAGDDFQASKTGTAVGQEEGQAQMRGGANFSRFKTLETIKRQHEENERRKKEEEARQQQAKRQAHAEHEAQKKREEAARQAEQTALLQQQRQEAMLRQQREQQEQMRAATHAQQMAAAAQSTQTPQSATQPQFSSPVVRQGTPMAAAASPHPTAQPSHSLGGTPMVATSSNHGAGSPPRPPSAVSHPIVRTESQSRPSRTGTPQMIQGTPVMNAAIPPRNISSTPQPPRMPQGSPTIPMQGGTPIMMQSQPGQSITPEQMNQMRAAQMGNNGMRTPQGMQMGQNPIQQLQQLAMAKARQHIQQQGVPTGQNMVQYSQLLAQRYFTQLQQGPQNQQHAGVPNMSPGQGMPGGNTGMPTQGATNPANMSYQQLKNTYMHRSQQLVQSYGSIQAAPPQHQQMMQSLQLAIRKKEQEMHQAQSAGAQVTGGMNPGMTAMGNMSQTPQQMQQWQAALNHQRIQQHQQQAQAARQQQLLMQQRQQMAASGQLNGNMMGNMGMMNPGQMNMNMQNMQNMGQMNVGSMQNMQAMQNMQGMQGMNMGQMSQPQLQMMLMRQQQQMRAGQQQQAQQQQQQQRVSQGDGGIDWSGVSQ